MRRVIRVRQVTALNGKEAAAVNIAVVSRWLSAENVAPVHAPAASS